MLLAALPLGAVITGVLAAVLLCQRSLALHVQQVSDGLHHQLASGQGSVSTFGWP
jgi:cobalamin biosynthesis protein CobD/CbiB